MPESANGVGRTPRAGRRGRASRQGWARGGARRRSGRSLRRRLRVGRHERRDVERHSARRGRRELLGLDRRAARRRQGRGDEHHHQSQHRPALLRADGGRRAHHRRARRWSIVNGIGYDPWATQLLAANPVSGRVVLNVGQLVHVAAGGNPHRWYSPTDVHAVIDQITADYQRLDPTDAAYFAAQRTAYLSQGLAALRPAHRRHQGRSTPARRWAPRRASSRRSPRRSGSSCSRRRPFLTAISEGTEPTAADKATIDRQIAHPADQGLRLQLAERHPRRAGPGAGGTGAGIPVTTITETLVPGHGHLPGRGRSRSSKPSQAALAKATGH